MSLQNQTRNRLTLIALFALFFVPILAAVLLHSEWITWQADPDRAHGELIQPVVPLGEFRLTDAEGRSRTADDLVGRWQLVHVALDGCNAACLDRLILMRNLRIAQDRHADEIGLLLITNAEFDEPAPTPLGGHDAGWTIFDGAAGAQLLARFPEAADGTFYIVDPEANIMERFPPGVDLNDVRKDLDRLLTWTVREQ